MHRIASINFTIEMGGLGFGPPESQRMKGTIESTVQSMVHPRPLFKQTLQFLQQTYVQKMSIQYTLPEFKPTTFGT